MEIICLIARYISCQSVCPHSVGHCCTLLFVCFSLPLLLFTIVFYLFIKGTSRDENAIMEEMNLEDLDGRTNSEPVTLIYSDHLKESQKLEEEIDQVLQSLRKSQECEYKVAEESLHVQRNYLHNLYEQLDKEKAELAHRTSNAEPDELLNAILNREDQIKREVLKLREMEKVANGFGRASKRILKEYFDTEIEE